MDTLLGVTVILLAHREHIPRVGLMVVIGYEDLTKTDGVAWDMGDFLGGQKR